MSATSEAVARSIPAGGTPGSASTLRGASITTARDNAAATASFSRSAWGRVRKGRSECDPPDTAAAD
jgi:hypothetical protein